MIEYIENHDYKKTRRKQLNISSYNDMMNTRRGGDNMSKKYDELLHTLCIYDSVEKVPYEGCIFLKDGKIANVEKGSIKDEYLEKADTVTECGDKTVCAGFGDTHTFFTGYVIEHLGVDFSDCHSIEQLEKKVTAQKDIVHVMFGNHLEKKFVKNEAAEKMLERVMPDKAVVLFTEGHATCLMNEKAKAEFGFDEDHCYSEAIYKIMPLYLNDRSFIEKELISYMKLLNSRGITSVKEMGFDDFYGFTDVLEEMELNHELTLRIAFMSQPVGAEPNIKYAKDMEQKFKGDYVRFSGFNQMTDGLILKKEGHLLEPYEGTTITCKKEIDYEKLEKQVLEADENGIRYTLHSEGDGAFHEILNIYEKCRKKNGKLENRHGITDLELTEPEDEKRMAALGAFGEIYAQVYALDTYEGYVNAYEQVIGERQKRYLNYRSLIKNGVRLCGATDLPLLIPSIPESIYYGCANYGSDHNKRINPENGLSVQEMIDAWTINSQYAMERERELGSIETGKKADLVIFDRNIFKTPMEEMLLVQVEKTMVNGKIVYTKEEEL
ncbi:amidohydrolase [Roseburia inulinivorans]|uniref:Amidohydrolase n=2 Tax=Roseburia inulinivorans TaxID=360807 RepID=A0A414LF75_9FIRM|nr:amidohydrolase [Roseburia inulinivorans]